MSSFTWRAADAAGRPLANIDAMTFPTQSEAQAWLGETWQDLADAGAHSVTLVEGEVEVYGPMSLSPG